MVSSCSVPRFSSTPHLTAPIFKLMTVDDRSFSSTGPRAIHLLPQSLRADALACSDATPGTVSVLLRCFFLAFYWWPLIHVICSDFCCGKVGWRRTDRPCALRTLHQNSQVEQLQSTLRFVLLLRRYCNCNFYFFHYAGSGMTSLENIAIVCAPLNTKPPGVYPTKGPRKCSRPPSQLVLTMGTCLCFKN